jgi:hypothetical protein
MHQKSHQQLMLSSGHHPSADLGQQEECTGKVVQMALLSAQECTKNLIGN